jgi:hypothetical protein
MDFEIRAMAAGSRLDAPPMRTVLRQLNETGGGEELEFACVGRSGATCAWACARGDEAKRWDVGLYVSGACDHTALGELLGATIDAIRERGGQVLRAGVEFEGSDALKLFEDLGIPLMSMMRQGGEARAEFGIAGAHPAIPAAGQIG